MNPLKPTDGFVSLMLGVCLLLFCNTNAQTPGEKAFIGTWEIQGTLIGDDGEGMLLPHQQAGPDCEADHSFFAADHTAKEVRFNRNCDAKENTFDWKLDGDTLTLTKDGQRINWLIHSIQDGKMTVGIPIRPGSEKRMYVVYKKQN